MLIPKSFRPFGVLLAVGIAGAAGASHAAQPAAREPAARAFTLRAAGVQIYECARSDAGASWRLRAPEAELRDSSGAVAGRHFAGPTWQAGDSSTVVGAPLASSPAPQNGAIPWLVLRAASHAGAGTLARVAFITRTQTAGGVAPAGGCTPGDSGRVARIPYTATYTFFPSDDRRP